jgi:hypothetical protein
MQKHVGVKKYLEHINKKAPLIPGAFVDVFTNGTTRWSVQPSIGEMVVFVLRGNTGIG